MDASSSRRLEVLGLPVDLIDREELRSWLESVVGSNSGCRHLVTLNPEYVMHARRERAFAAAIRAADLVIADGVGVSKAGSLKLRAVGARTSVVRIPGVEIVEMIAQCAGSRLFMLGAGSGVADRAASVLATRFPEVLVAGTWSSGSAGADDDAESLRRIAAAGANVVLVAYGAGGQVGWIARNQSALTAHGIRLAIGVGGAFDFISGDVTRAPERVRRVGFEWLYRLVREPWRWRRQLVLPVFALLALGDVTSAWVRFQRYRFRRSV